MNIPGKFTARWKEVVFCLLALFTAGATGLYAGQVRGEAEFREHCSECHFAGGNIVKATKTLSERDRVRNGVVSANDILKIMRAPGEGMTRFDEKTVPEEEARKIADYIIATFK